MRDVVRNSNVQGISRRGFLAAGGTVAGFLLVPSRVLGRGGEASPNAKLNLAGVGIGGQGGADLEAVRSENIVALCDVDWDYAAKTFQRYPGAKVATQMGNQGMAFEGNRLINEWLWDGAIGPVREVHVWSDSSITNTAKAGRYEDG